MPSLHDCQTALAKTLDYGPDTLPSALFTGSIDRVHLGLKAHANSISHARLVALEDTFPRYRACVGDAEFNRLSRAYLASGLGCDRPIAVIGAAFSRWLSDDIVAGNAALPSPALAQLEWLWLTSFHAADAAPLAASALAQHGESLLDLPLVQHPAAAVMPISVSIAMLLDAPDWADAPAILISRPHFTVLTTAMTPPMLALWLASVDANTLGIALAALSDDYSEDDLIGALLTLIGVGAFSAQGALS